MFQTKDVTEWTETFRAVDLPDLRLTFGGLFGHLLLLQFDLNTTTAITSPLIGGWQYVGQHLLLKLFRFVWIHWRSEGVFHQSLFALVGYTNEGYNSECPGESSALWEHHRNSYKTSLCISLARENHWSWRHNSYITYNGLHLTFFIEDLNLSPEANALGAALLPHVNMFANNLTLWNLTVEDVQQGGGYPGSERCNNVIPHAKWHVQTAASLADMARLVDFVLYLEQKYIWERLNCT